MLSSVNIAIGEPFLLAIEVSQPFLSQQPTKTTKQ
jgi:hypothetical protein